MLALGLAQAKNIAIIIVIVLVVIAVVVAKLVSNVTKKVIGLLILAALALGVFTQRQSLQTCADKARAVADGSTATCTFFGSNITIKAPTT